MLLRSSSGLDTIIDSLLILLTQNFQIDLKPRARLKGGGFGVPFQFPKVVLDGVFINLQIGVLGYDLKSALVAQCCLVNMKQSGMGPFAPSRQKGDEHNLLQIT